MKATSQLEVNQLKQQITLLQKDFGNAILELALNYQQRIDTLLQQIESLKQKEEQ